MSHDPADDFGHPQVPDGVLRRHVLYRMRREQWPTREPRDHPARGTRVIIGST